MKRERLDTTAIVVVAMKTSLSEGGEPSSSTSSINSPDPLYSKYPISSQWEFTLKNGDVVKGEIYCTDPLADVVVVLDALKDVRMIAAVSITASKQLKEASAEAQQKLASNENIVHSMRALEEREKRAIRIAQDSLKHLNPKVRRDARHNNVGFATIQFGILSLDRIKSKSMISHFCFFHRKRHRPRDKPFLTGCSRPAKMWLGKVNQLSCWIRSKSIHPTRKKIASHCKKDPAKEVSKECRRLSVRSIADTSAERQQTVHKREIFRMLLSICEPLLRRAPNIGQLKQQIS